MSFSLLRLWRDLGGSLPQDLWTDAPSFRSLSGWDRLLFHLPTAYRQCSGGSAKAEPGPKPFLGEASILADSKSKWIPPVNSGVPQTLCIRITWHAVSKCRFPSPTIRVSDSVYLRHQSAFSRVLISIWWTRDRYLRNVKLLRVLTSKVKHLFLDLSGETNRRTFWNRSRAFCIPFEDSAHYTSFRFGNRSFSVSVIKMEPHLLFRFIFFFPLICSGAR